MKRNIDMNEISDGKLYDLNDMVKADCNDCKGCSACCKGMGQSIVLDPLDVFRLTTGLHMRFEELLLDAIELSVFDGIILPNLKMGQEEEACYFLNKEGRCSIHAFRPGICRLFPLGRYYENHDFKYFLQIHECKNTSKTKVKVKKWIDIPDIEKNREFVNLWHDFVENIQIAVMQVADEELVKKIDMFVLQHFFIEPYGAEEDFYEQFKTRLEKANKVTETLLRGCK